MNIDPAKLKRYVDYQANKHGIKSDVKFTLEHNTEERNVKLELVAYTVFGPLKEVHYFDSSYLLVTVDRDNLVMDFIDDMIEDIANYIMEKATCGY